MMKLSHASLALLAAVAMTGFASVDSRIYAQDDPAADSESGKPKPVIFKAGEKVQVKWGSSWWDATIVGNMGGGKYRIRWTQGNWPEETKSISDIRRPGEEASPASESSSRASSRQRSSSTQKRDSGAQESAPEKSPGYRVGDAITWKSGEKNLTGTISTLINDTMLKAVITGEEEEKIVLIKNILTAPTPKETTAAKKPAGSNKTGFYVKGQEIEYTFVNSTKPGTVIRDRGAKVFYMDPTWGKPYEIERSKIVTPPELEKADPAFARMIMDKAVNVSDSRGAHPTPKAESVKYSAGPASLDAQPPVHRIKIENPKPSGIGHRTAENLFICATLPVGFVTFKAADAEPGHMIQYDLTTGKPARTLKFPGSTQVIDVAPNGSRALTLTKGKLTLWSLEEKEPVKTLAFEAFGPGSDFEPDADRALLIGDNFLFISSADAVDTSVWRIGTDSLTCVWYTGEERDPAIYLNPQRTAVLVKNWSSFSIFDSISGKSVCKPSLPFINAAAFSTDGKRLALYSSHSRDITIFNVSDRQTEKTIPLPTGAMSENDGSPTLQWIGSENILIADKYLINVKSGIISWQFTSIVPFKCTGSGIAWALMDDSKGGQTLASTYLLDNNVTQAINNASPEKNALLKEGDSIALNVNVDGGPPGIGDRARQGFEKFFQEKKISVNPNAPIKLNLTGSAEPAKELLVRENFTKESKVSYRTSTYKLEIIKDGKTVWSTGGGYYGPRGVVVRDQNETYQQAIDRNMQEAYRWLEKPSIPIPLLKSLKDNPPGSSPLFP